MKPNFKEEYISQIPALKLLMNLGYEYLTPQQAKAYRGERLSQVILTEVLTDWLRANNQIEFRGEVFKFSESNITRAVEEVTKLQPGVGLMPQNEQVTELLTLGTSLEQTINGNRRSHSLRYIDWAHPENNIYHVTDEFSVKRQAHNDPMRPDIVVFVNGIPLVVIECKRPDLNPKHGGKAVSAGIEQMIRNQKTGNIPHLFAYAQILLSVATNDARYATVGTPEKFWQLWQEDIDLENIVYGLINQPLSETDKDALYSHRRYSRSIRHYFDEQESAERLPTMQDNTLYSLLHPERLLELVYQYILFDAGTKKIARYQQYFAIKATLERVVHRSGQQQRQGGVIWHTTGSGKSLTMVMLSKALTLHPAVKNPRVVLVTDRVNLDEQIWKTFNACGKTAEKATSGKALGKLIRQGKVDIITTVIDKFETAARDGVREESGDIFILVDESHRSQYGTSHAKMKNVFPNGCYIGFTGTPLLKKDKTTADKFGGFIHKYTMRQAVDDGAVVPLLYEGRLVDYAIDHDQLDTWFERRTSRLNEEQRADLKRKMSRADEVNKVDQRLQLIAWDIAQHYKENWRGTGFKAQLATSSKLVGYKYRNLLKGEGISCELVISAPDTREGNTEVNESQTPELELFWQDMMSWHGNEESYNRNVKNDFAKPDEGLEILIVVDKLLVGFDEPRNTVLYVDKSLKEHNLLQAIARVNRLFEGKEYGYVVDYRGVLGDLNEAMEVYNALEGFDVEDVAGTITDVSAVLDQLPQHFEQLWDVFKTVENSQDAEAIERFLEPEDRRDHFYDALNTYASSLRVALSSETFYEQQPENRINRYKQDLKFFHNLRQSVKQRYAETIDYREYEDKVRKLMDTHIRAQEIVQITELVNIFDVEAFDREVARVTGANAKADTILHRLKKTAIERMDEDPAFYRKFSRLIDETIQAYREGRISEAEKFQRASDYLDQVRDGQDSTLPTVLRNHRHASAYFGVLKEFEGEPLLAQLSDEVVANFAVQVEQVIESQKIRDWVTNQDVQNNIRNALEDCLYGFQNEQKISVNGATMDILIDGIVDVAIKRNDLA